MSDFIALVEGTKKPPQTKKLYHGFTYWSFYMVITIIFESVNASCRSVDDTCFSDRLCEQQVKSCKVSCRNRKLLKVLTTYKYFFSLELLFISLTI